MKKTVFKGTINGVEFDNVNDYNKEMNRLISEGCTNIQAQSSTSIVDDKCEEGCKCEGECKCGECKCEKCAPNVSPWPGFENPDRHFLDVLLENESESYNEKLQKLEEHLEDEFEDIINSNEFKDLFTLNSYKKDISDILEEFENTYNKTNSAYNTLQSKHKDFKKQYDEICAKMEAVENKLGQLGFAFDAIEKYQTFYKKLYDKIGSQMKNTIVSSPEQESKPSDFYSKFIQQLFDL